MIGVGGVECPIRIIDTNSLSCDPPRLTGFQIVPVMVSAIMKMHNIYSALCMQECNRL